MFPDVQVGMFACEKGGLTIRLSSGKEAMPIAVLPTDDIYSTVPTKCILKTTGSRSNIETQPNGTICATTEVGGWVRDLRTEVTLRGPPSTIIQHLL